LEVVLYFVQVSPLLVNSVAQERLRDVLSGLLSVASLRLSGFSSGGGLCLFPSLDSMQLEAMNYIPPAIIMCWLVVFTVVAMAYKRLRKVPVGNQQRRLRLGRVWAGLSATGLELGEFTYMSILRTTFSLLQCREVEGSLVLYIQGDTLCYTVVQRLLIVVSVPLVLYPFAILRLALRASPRTAVGNAVWNALCAPYRDSCRLFAGQNLLRRLLITMVFTFESDGTSRSFGLFFLCLGFCCIDIMYQPHREKVTTACNFVVQTSLVSLSATNVFFTLASEYGIASSEQSVPSAITAASFILPLAGFCLVVFTAAYHRKLEHAFRRFKKRVKKEAGMSVFALEVAAFQDHHIVARGTLQQRLQSHNWQSFALRLLLLEETKGIESAIDPTTIAYC